jgi:beta-lactamase regulating signal transducer with metallopeptidase domain
MDILLELNWLNALGSALLHSFWQMALLWLIYELMFNVKNTRAATRHKAAMIFLHAGFAWFLFTFIYSVIRFENQGMADYFLQPSSLTNTIFWVKQQLPYIAMLYIVLLIFQSFQLINAYRYTNRLRTRSLQKIGVDWRLYVQEMAIQLGIKRKVKIWLSALVESPVTIGWLKPVILVPLSVINQLTPEQMEAVLLHELAHIRRNDYFIQFLTFLIETILFFNPFVKFLSNHLQKEREYCCDDWVLQFRFSPQSYSTALLRLEQTRISFNSLAIPAVGEKKQLLQRVKRIMNLAPVHHNYTGRKIMAFASVALILGLWLFAGSFPARTTTPVLVQTGSFNWSVPVVNNSYPTTGFVYTETQVPANSNTGSYYEITTIVPPSEKIPEDAALPVNESFTEQAMAVAPAFTEEDIEQVSTAVNEVSVNGQALNVNLIDLLREIMDTMPGLLNQIKMERALFEAKKELEQLKVAQEKTGVQRNLVLNQALSKVNIELQERAINKVMQQFRKQNIDSLRQLVVQMGKKQKQQELSMIKLQNQALLYKQQEEAYRRKLQEEIKLTEKMRQRKIVIL